MKKEENEFQRVSREAAARAKEKWTRTIQPRPCPICGTMNRGPVCANPDWTAVTF